MRKLFLSVFLFFVPLLASGCGARQAAQSEEYAVSNWGREGFLTEDGYYYTRDSENGAGILLYYHDFAADRSVPVCDRAECAHQVADTFAGEEVSCNAQIDVYDGIAVYKNKIYYITHGDRTLLLRSRDTDGNNDEKVAEFDASDQIGNIWYYRNHAFITALTDVSQSFDPKTRESKESSMRFFAVNLKTGDVEVLGESPEVESEFPEAEFFIYRMEAGNVYYRDSCRDKWYVYDTDRESAAEQEDMPADAMTGKAGPYHVPSGEFAYGYYTDEKNCRSIMRKNLQTGEELVLYTGKPGNATGYSYSDWLPGGKMIFEDFNSEKGKTEDMLLYDMDSGETEQVPEEFYAQKGMTGVIQFDKKGAVYKVWGEAVKVEGEAYAQAEWEDRYATWEDIFAGNKAYQVIQTGTGDVVGSADDAKTEDTRGGTEG